jgi:predicted GIY-YIG superfamily endonuclease
MDGPVVYCLLEMHHQRRTYVGYTLNLTRRLRQHRGELQGGAKCTTSAGPDSDWQVLYVVRGLPSRQAAMQLEWRLHRMGRHGPRQRGQLPSQRRLEQVRAALAMDRWTLRAPIQADMPDLALVVSPL